MNIICKECGKEFNISSKEQDFYASMNYEMPKRCSECRKARRAVKKEAEAQKKWEEAEKKLSILLKSLPYQITSLEKLKFENGAFTCYYWEWIRYNARCEIFLLGFSKDYWKE